MHYENERAVAVALDAEAEAVVLDLVESQQTPGPVIAPLLMLLVNR
jgi:hypothetical protein